jgi:hypothetical protein
MNTPKIITADLFLSIFGLGDWVPAYVVLLRSKPDSSNKVKLKMWEDVKEHAIFHWHQFDQDWPKAKWVGLFVYGWLWLRTGIKTVITFKLQEHPMEREAHEHEGDARYLDNRMKKAWRAYK